MRLLPGSKFKNFFIWSANFLRMWPDSCATLFHEPKRRYVSSIHSKKLC